MSETPHKNELIIKFFNDADRCRDEFNTMRTIWDMTSMMHDSEKANQIAQVYEHHELEDTEHKDFFVNNLAAFLVMPRYGSDLQNLYSNLKDAVSVECVLKIGRALLDQLRMIHEAGYVHNDLKLDNVVLPNAPHVEDLQDLNKIAPLKLLIIDYGFATSYVDRMTGQHVEQREELTFSGNIMLASANKLKMMTSSRRDDLISLCYMLVYLMDDNLTYLQGIDFRTWNQQAFKVNIDHDSQVKQIYEQIVLARDTITIEQLCSTERS